jgi:outer membrane murein-binding lipoprotein Lpp
MFCRYATDVFAPLAANDSSKSKYNLDSCITLLCAALAAGLSLAGCTSERLAPVEPTPVNAECQQMRNKLATDQTLTPAQAAEITKNMEKAGCARRLPGR